VGRATVSNRRVGRDSHIADKASKIASYEASDAIVGAEEVYLGFGGKRWFEMAKKYCCNFEVRFREGYCCDLFTLKAFKGKCSDCHLGMALNLRHI
jgi:hypothetical protein